MTFAFDRGYGNSSFFPKRAWSNSSRAAASLGAELHPVDADLVPGTGIVVTERQAQRVAIEREHAREVLDVEEREPEPHDGNNGLRWKPIPRLTRSA